MSREEGLAMDHAPDPVVFFQQLFLRNFERCIEMCINIERSVGIHRPSPSISFMQEQLKVVKVFMRTAGCSVESEEYSYDHLPPAPPAYFEQVLEE